MHNTIYSNSHFFFPMNVFYVHIFVPCAKTFLIPGNPSVDAVNMDAQLEEEIYQMYLYGQTPEKYFFLWTLADF